MEILVWIGTLVTALGLAGVVWSLVSVARARRAGLDDDALRERMKRILPINLGAFFLSFLGLMMVVVGVILG
jgi:hypothetical protein